MSEAQLREIERRFRESGSIEDEATWLRALAKAGTLTQRRLKLLSCLGHPAAALIEPAVEPNPLEFEGMDEPGSTWDVFCAWFVALDELDPCARVAAGAALGDLLLQHSEPGLYGGDLVEMVSRLRSAALGDDLEDSSSLLADMRIRVGEMNQEECNLDTGSVMPPERDAARALTWIGFAFSGEQLGDDLANAAITLGICDSSLETPRAIADRFVPLMIPLLLKTPVTGKLDEGRLYRLGRSRAGIRVAAYLGLTACGELVNAPAREKPEEGLEQWLTRLAELGSEEAVTRALLAATRAFLARLPETDGAEVAQLLDQIEAPLALGGPGFHQVRGFVEEWGRESGREPPRRPLLAALVVALQYVNANLGHKWPHLVKPSSVRVAEWIALVRAQAVEGVSPSLLYSAAREELATWATGEGDPVVARVKEAYRQ